MPTSRASLVKHVVDLVGSDVLKIKDIDDGWPALIDVKLDGGVLPIALHVGPAGLSGRGRDDVERRFQNPGKDKPITAPAGYLPVLLGVWEEREKPVLYALDAEHRLGKVTRQSLFAPLDLLVQALSDNWAERPNGAGEQVTAFAPELFPSYLEILRGEVRLPPVEVAQIAQAAGISTDEAEPPSERARRVATQLVRDAIFGKKVRTSYNDRCAMCGFNFSLVSGAHILPAEAPGSPDSVWNGLALCHNHHAAFDRHRVFVEPDSRAIKIHPLLLEAAGTNASCDAFLENTFSKLAEPLSPKDRPKREMFEQRYSFYTTKYDWA